MMTTVSRSTKVLASKWNNPKYMWTSVPWGTREHVHFTTVKKPKMSKLWAFKKIKAADIFSHSRSPQLLLSRCTGCGKTERDFYFQDQQESRKFSHITPPHDTLQLVVHHGSWQRIWGSDVSEALPWATTTQWAKCPPMEKNPQQKFIWSVNSVHVSPVCA